MNVLVQLIVKNGVKEPIQANVKGLFPEQSFFQLSLVSY